MTTNGRRKLPSRRPCETVEMQYDGQKYIVAIGYYPAPYVLDNGVEIPHHLNEIAEVFVTGGGKVGSDRHTELMSIGVTASFALQHGADPKRMLRSHPKNEDGSPASLQGAIWGRLAAEQR